MSKMISGVVTNINIGYARPAVAKPDKQRLAMLDVAKGIGIMLVVLGHNPFFHSEYSAYNEFIGAFRLPFFFFMSGVTFPVSAGVGSIMRSRTSAWLKPFFVVTVIVGLCRLLSGAGTVEEMLLSAVYATGFTLIWEPMWFLPHLWLLYVFAALVMGHGARWLSGWVRQVAWLLLLCVAGSYVFDAFNAPLDHAACWAGNKHFGLHLLRCGLPFSVDLVLLTAVYFFAGSFLSAQVKAFRFDAVGFALGVAVVVGMFLASGYRIDFNYRRYDHVLFSTIGAFAGIYAMLGLCSMVSRSAMLARHLSQVGAASLFILMFHAYVMDKAGNVVVRLGGTPAATGLVSYLVALGVPIGMLYLCKKNRYMTALLLPRRRRAATGAGPDTAIEEVRKAA